ARVTGRKVPEVLPERQEREITGRREDGKVKWGRKTPLTVFPPSCSILSLGLRGRRGGRRPRDGLLRGLLLGRPLRAERLAGRLALLGGGGLGRHRLLGRFDR